MTIRRVVAVTSAALLSFGAIAGGEQHSSAQSATVRQAQERLASQGFNPGPVDGRLGQQTQQGLKAFQESKGLEPSGRLDAQTIAALGLESDSSAATGASSPGQSSSGATPSSPERAAEPAGG